MAIINNPNTNETFFSEIRNHRPEQRGDFIVEVGEVSQPLSDPQYTVHLRVERKGSWDDWNVVGAA